MTGTIVVGSDGSAPSRSALRWAAQRADHGRMGLLLCRVMEQELGGLHLSASSSRTDAAAELEAEARRARVDFPSVDIRSSLMYGQPVALLAELGGRADLLVLGTHKTGFIQGRAFESRFAGLSALLDAPIAFIPDVQTSHRRGVVVEVDGSPVRPAVIRQGAAEAERFGDPMILVGASASSLERVAARASTDYPGLAIHVRHVDRGTAHALIDASWSARVLIIGNSTDPFRASAIQDVLLNLSCPTIIVREPLITEGTTACVGSAESA